MSHLRRVLTIVAAGLGGAALAGPARAIDREHRERGEEMARLAVEFLRSRQDVGGGWSHSPRGPALPAITGLVLNGLLMQPEIGADDPAVGAAVSYLLSYKQEDGGIYDVILPSYNTAIAVSALSRLPSEEARRAVKDGVAFLRTLQFGAAEAAGLAAAPPGEVGRDVDPSHPFYGGVGYGTHGRPDNSNLTFFVQAMRDAGVPGDDPALRRAVVFLERTQMHESVNEMPYARGSRQGGFIYSTSRSREPADVGVGQSFAGMVEETMDDGTRVSRLRAYGSMTYAAFKSYIYANLRPDDPRVALAVDWIGRNYTLDENPGLGTDGMYYYFLTFARALDAWGDRPDVEPASRHVIEIESPGAAAAPEERDWANDLIDRLGALQNDDGSFRIVDERWMESNPDLITAYALLALGHALRD